MKTVLLTLGSVFAFLFVLYFGWVVATSLIFATAKTEKPLNDIHREATECSLEYVNSTQATLRSQITQYSGLGPDATDGQRRALVSQMHAEADVIDACNRDTLSPSIRSFLSVHPTN